MKLKDIEKYIDDTLLDVIFKERAEKLYIEDQQDNEEISKIKEKYPIDYEKLLNYIKNIPPHFKNTRENILDAIDVYLMRENLLTAYDNEKFYKIRFLRWY